MLAYIATPGDGDRAARLAGYADQSFARIGFTPDDVPQAIHDRLPSLLRELLAPADLARLSADGAALTPEPRLPWLER